MVAIQTLFTIAMAALATAAPALRGRAVGGTVNANLNFYRIDDPSCAQFPDGTAYLDSKTIFNTPLTSGETLAVNTCISHSAWGSIAINQIGPGCTRKSTFSPLSYNIGLLVCKGALDSY